MNQEYFLKLEFVAWTPFCLRSNSSKIMKQPWRAVIFLGVGSANERRRYKVTSSLFGRAYTQMISEEHGQIRHINLPRVGYITPARNTTEPRAYFIGHTNTLYGRLHQALWDPLRSNHVYHHWAYGMDIWLHLHDTIVCNYSCMPYF